jgi:hypothetical protein
MAGQQHRDKLIFDPSEETLSKKGGGEGREGIGLQLLWSHDRIPPGADLRLVGESGWEHKVHTQLGVWEKLLRYCMDI